MKQKIISIFMILLFMIVPFNFAVVYGIRPLDNPGCKVSPVDVLYSEEESSVTIIDNTYNLRVDIDDMGLFSDDILLSISEIG